MTLTDLLRKIYSPARALAFGAALYGCGGTSESPYDGSSGNKNPPATKECRDETPYLDIQFTLKVDGSCSLQERFEGHSAEERGDARGWVRCGAGNEIDHGFYIRGESPETIDQCGKYGVFIRATDDYRGPGAYDVQRACMNGGFESRKGVTSLNALLISEDVGRICVSGAVELYLDWKIDLNCDRNEYPVKGVPGTLQFQGMCREFVEND